MDKEIKMLSPCKVNLHLHIGKKRDDGFHDIESLFQLIDLCDEINVCSLKNSNECIINGDFGFPGEQNIISKAWKLFCDFLGYPMGVKVNVVKNVPMGAGLGGGSSNGAHFIKIMEILSGVTLDADKRLEMAAAVGSDVPFFLTSNAAVVTGRGEVINTIPSRDDYVLVICSPAVYVSTADAYTRLDEERAKGAVEQADYIDVDRIGELYKGPMDAWPFYNSFQPLFIARFPLYGRIFDTFAEADALFSTLTGSGSAAVGLFNDPQKADAAKKNLQKAFSFVKVAKPLDS